MTNRLRSLLTAGTLLSSLALTSSAIANDDWDFKTYKNAHMTQKEKLPLSKSEHENGFLVIYQEEYDDWCKINQLGVSFNRFTDDKFKDGIENHLFPDKPNLSKKEKGEGVNIIYHDEFRIWEKVFPEGHPEIIPFDDGFKPGVKKIKPRSLSPWDVWTRDNWDYKNKYMTADGGVNSPPPVTNQEREDGFVRFFVKETGLWIKIHQENKNFDPATKFRYSIQNDGGFQNDLFGVKPTLTEAEKRNGVFLDKHPNDKADIWEKMTRDHPLYYRTLLHLTEDGNRPRHLGPVTELEKFENLKEFANYSVEKPPLSEELRQKGFIVLYAPENNLWVKIHQDHGLFHNQTKGTFDDGIENDLYPYKPKLSKEDAANGAVVVGFPSLAIWEISRDNNPKHREYAKTLDDKLAQAGLTREQYNRGITSASQLPKPEGKRRTVNDLDLGPSTSSNDDVYINTPQSSSSTVRNNRPVSWMDTYVPGSGLDPRIRNVIFASPLLRKQYERESRAAMDTMGLNPAEFDQQANFEFMMGFNSGFTQARNRPYKTINDLNREAGRGYSLGGGMRINGRGEAYTENDDGGWNREPAFDE